MGKIQDIRDQFKDGYRKHIDELIAGRKLPLKSNKHLFIACGCFIALYALARYAGFNFLHAGAAFGAWFAIRQLYLFFGKRFLFGVAAMWFGFLIYTYYGMPWTPFVHVGIGFFLYEYWTRRAWMMMVIIGAAAFFFSGSTSSGWDWAYLAASPFLILFGCERVYLGGDWLYWNWKQRREWADLADIKDTHGAARQADLVELEKLGCLDGKGPILGMYKDGKNDVVVTEPTKNSATLNIGSPGKGKTTSQVIPRIFSEAMTQCPKTGLLPSLLINDPKSELGTTCGPVLEDLGYSVRYINSGRQFEEICPHTEYNTWESVPLSIWGADFPFEEGPDSRDLKDILDDDVRMPGEAVS